MIYIHVVVLESSMLHAKLFQRRRSLKMVDDGRTTDDGRTPDHGHPISSPCEPDGSGELKMHHPSINTMIHTFDHTIKPSLLYSSEIWGMYETETKKRKINQLKIYLMICILNKSCRRTA